MMAVQFTRHSDGTVTGIVQEPDAVIDVHYVDNILLAGKQRAITRRHLAKLGLIELGPDPDHPTRTLFVHRPDRAAGS